jgi:hypothetical protein
MAHSKLLRPAFLLLLGVALALQPTVALSASPPPAQGVRLTPIGNPTWKPVDFHLFSAPIGTAATGFTEFLETLQALLPPPNHAVHPDLGIGPGAPHVPPYDSELATGVANEGFHEGVRFKQSEFSNGEGVILAWMNVPAPGTTGSSPDFASGPIIPNSLFPIHFSGRTLHNGKVFSEFSSDVPPLDTNLDPPFDVDGHSHFPLFFAESAEFAPTGTANLRGSYQFEFQLIDQAGNGWRITAHFTVAP